MDKSLCIDCYEAPRACGELCKACYNRMHRRQHYHQVIWGDPERLERHREQSREGMRAVRERRALERRLRVAAEVMADPDLAAQVRLMLRAKAAKRG